MQATGIAATYRRLRHQTWELLHSPEIDSRLEVYFRSGLAILIVLNILVVMLETVPELEVRFRDIFLAFEWFSVVVFGVEYILRIWSAVETERFRHPLLGRLRYAFTFFALIDLIAVAPFFIPAFVDVDLIFLRGLRLIRLLRILKLGRYSTSLSMLVRVCRRKTDDILVSLSIILLILLLSSSLMYYLEHQAQPESFPNIFAALWWGVATLTTVGYGDIYPVTILGKLCAAVISILGIGLVALPSGLLVAGFLEEMQTPKDQKCCPHCGKPID